MYLKEGLIMYSV